MRPPTQMPTEPQVSGYPFSIARKIWLSLSLMLVGYTVTMVFGFLRGDETRERLSTLAQEGFPAAIESQAALTAFKEQIALYSDAVTLGEVEAIDEAAEFVRISCNALQDLRAPLPAGDSNRQEADDLMEAIQSFTLEAAPAYKRLAMAAEDEELEVLAGELATRYADIERRLQTFQESLSKGVKSELHDVSQATKSLWYTNLGIFFLVVTAAFGLVSYIIHRWITAPLQKAAEFARNMAAGDLSQLLDLKQNDEIGELARAFNTMTAEIEKSQSGLETLVSERTAELEQTHQELMVAARMAGMAEVASSVLHNVGNVLNSVNVTTTSIRSRVKESKVEKLMSVCELLEENEGRLVPFLESDPRGQKVLPYLFKLTGHLADERGRQLEMLDSLHDHVQHITAIISQQQANSRAANLTEELDLACLIDDAVALACARSHAPDLVVHQALDRDLPRALADRHKTLQILVNLLNNARQAVQASQTEEPTISIRVIADGEREALITVTDNGVGISPSNLRRLFTHGFTTKAEGHGFGLHSAILAAEEMGGSLTAESPGEGLGAVFSLRLPLAQMEACDA